MDGKALISNIALSKGAELEVKDNGCDDTPIGVIDVLSGISTTHLLNLSSPSFMEYYAGTTRRIRLLGLNGTASFSSQPGSYPPSEEFPRLPLTNVRRFHLDTEGWEPIQPGLATERSTTFHPSPHSRHLPSGTRPICQTSSLLCCQTLHLRPH